ncbi:hypothetical protein Misp01_54450 [Microtetraspora sp. NBRC 13810]|uniref:hypothetical protein n=1 Tax=Microtetraspora sp. NBRC 13810 TaxID=3030990 RepID=UPI0024A582ED|nr:hypothetical protein [Microtetraspora sp. NBRC 13810]GLW10317.1 hypothetical protein Misp01_54450 [Microtetraspora sp. NBRC 13810]
MTGFTYTSVSLAPGSEPRVAISVFLDESTEVSYFPTTPDGRAFIAIKHGKVSVHLGISSDAEIIDEDLRLARELHDATARFLADCERLHADQDSAAA